ncbi:MAG: coproporphyrinogen III oxidase family protein [Planctomycetes bacterium]|nr:coproporphyrinogen III oxidase family protein [Planctomycetota bacterium]MBL7142673.1 coproporphyrinogen III oxidase family protein [Phycisphaerae bacterium]
MLIERFLRYCATRTTQHYLDFKQGLSCTPLLPEKSKKYLLYIHIPFCEQLCPYCSFVRIQFEPVLAARYFEVLKKEIKTYFSLGYQFDSIYVGGGTPTIWPEKLVEILSLAKSLWPIRQISTEANPDHLVPDILQKLKDVGVNRLSVGVQSFSDNILTSVNRSKQCGSSEDIKQRLASIKGMFDTLNVDMIFNFPNQTMEMLAEDVKTLKALNVDQVTYYPLMTSNCKQKEIEEECGKGHSLYERQAYDYIVDQLTGQYRCESVWCFSKQAGSIDEYIVSHDEYIGVGPGSWGYINGAMYHNTFSVQDYIQRVESAQSPITACRDFSKRHRMRYMFMLALIAGSLSLSDIKNKVGNHFWLFLGGELLFLLLMGALVVRDGKLVLTRRGRYYWVILMGTLFSVVGDYRDMCASSDDSILLFQKYVPLSRPRQICNIRVSSL